MRPPIIHHPDYQAPLRDDHRFPMSKYGYLREELIRGGLLKPGGYIAPTPATAAELARVHAADYVSRAFALTLTDAEMRKIGLPRTERVVRRARLSAAGSVLAGLLALEAGVACNSAGGSHHAGPEGGAGFSTFNDLAVAARALQARGVIRRALIFDCDVHQGDGTARIFADDDSVLTVSIHAQKNYPFEKARSDIDVGLEDGLTDAPYLEAVRATLDAALARGPFDIAFYNGGVDVHSEDRLGRLAITDAGLMARERLVLRRLRGAGLPVATALGGGYGPDPRLIAARHAALFTAAAELQGMSG
ncbi:MAG: histone deacetylase [Neomegalonema sp.]|nr:histone deacetylase [Neomegalonema sp.]